mgnify:CR=1 FL=1
MAELRFTWAEGVDENATGTTELVLLGRGPKIESGPEEVRKFLVDVNPSRSPQPDVFYVNDLVKGAGRVVVDGLNKNELKRLSQMVQVLEVNRKIGMSDPYYMAELPAPLQAVVPRNPNPYGQILFAIVFSGIGLLELWAAAFRFQGFSAINIFLVCTGLFMIGGAVWMFGQGWKRRKWWHAARAQVKRDGEKVPEMLQIFV